ncbi:MAG: DUF370 domain-containing protein [Clostridiales bacterium]|jgi:regulator of extracellular matrix RemA (YlzA/DUF370 family)|nr:DUF370 domain-containing protein [Clostridiales bacterium]MDD2571990.1 DUF370 domain-containing protein [Eubacteriales bacterium]MDY0120103.1 DUF370 domain-containing protein [Clostridia bacterium]NLG29570.1 DUF370 domain-containing protein [Clostridiaceae bacterium]MCK9349723.1 DUF370 domain-containing protein [Clostridiales bacterium]
MDYDMIPVGYGNFVARSRLIAVVTSDSAPSRRLIQDARERFALIDATGGKKTRSILVMDSDHVVLSSIDPESLPLRQEGEHRA